MKIFCVLNRTDQQKVIAYLGKAREIIQSRLIIDFDWHFEFIDEPVERKFFFEKDGKNHFGINQYHTNRWNTNAVGCQAIIYFYKTMEKDMFNWTYSIDGRPQIQIVFMENDLLPEIIAHELTHSLFVNLREKGIYLDDKLDFENQGLETILQELEKFKGAEDKLDEEMPVDAHISLLTRFKTLLNDFTLYLKGLRKLSDLMRYMEIMEGSKIVGSRGWRNNNPLNVKFIGQELALCGDKDNFAVFRDREDGWLVCKNDLISKIEGKTSTGLDGESAIKHLIYTWTETDKKEYLDYVCGKLNIKEDFKIKNFLYENTTTR